MWKLIMSEVKYHQKMIIGMLLFVPVWAVFYVQQTVGRWEEIVALRSIAPHFFLFWTFYVMAQQWTIGRNTEKRDRIFSLLPVSRWQVGLSRIGLVVGFTGIILCIFICFVLLMGEFTIINWNKLLLVASFALVLFSIYFFIRDLLMVWFRKFGFTKERVKTTVIMIALSLQLAGLFVYLFVKAKGAGPGFIPAIEKTIMAFNPMATDLRLVICIILGFISAGLTIPSFVTRQRFWE